MFGNIVTQVFGYYLIALLCIPLGIGHPKLQRWAWKITLTFLTLEPREMFDKINLAGLEWEVQSPTVA